MRCLLKCLLLLVSMQQGSGSSGCSPAPDSWNGDCSQYLWACTSSSYPWYKKECSTTCNYCESNCSPAPDSWDGDCSNYVWACTDSRYPWYKEKCSTTCKHCGCPIGYKKKDDNEAPYKDALAEDNVDVAKQFCFIVRDGGRTWILTDHKLLNQNFNEKYPGERCAYSPVVTKNNKLTIDTNQEKGGNSFSGGYTNKECCSQESGALCNKYNLYGSQVNTDECANTCKEIADCQRNPGNKWCQMSNIEEVLTDGPTITTMSDPKIPKDCVPQLEEEPVQQTAQFVPKAIEDAFKDMVNRKKRAVWNKCPAFNHFKFTCYQAVHYMLYYKQENWSRKKGKNGKWKGWKWFEHDCCSQAQSICRDHKKFKKHEAFAHCPPKG